MSGDPVTDFFDENGLALQGTAFGRVYWLRAHKRREWTKEDAEAYDQVSLSIEYMREREKGFEHD